MPHQKSCLPTKSMASSRERGLKYGLVDPIAKCVKNKNTQIPFVSLVLLLFVRCYNKNISS